MKYLAYTTPWSEGVVVARLSDKRFAIGYEPITGFIGYVESLAALLNTNGFDLIAIVDSLSEAQSLNSALYERVI
jgi:hypothetical protein